MKNKSETYFSRLENLGTYVEDANEALYSYDVLYNEINMTYEEADFRYGKVNLLNVEVLESINEGKKLNDEARGFVVDSQNNFQVRVTRFSLRSLPSTKVYCEIFR